MKLVDPEPGIVSKENNMLWLHILADAFVLVNAKGHVLHIAFQGGISTSKVPLDLPKDVRSYHIYGILGFIEGFREKYLVVITQAQVLGHIFNHAVYVIEQVACLSLDACRAREKLDEKIQALNETSDSEEEEQELPVKAPKPVVPTASFSTPTSSNNRARKQPGPLANRFRMSLTPPKRPTIEPPPKLKMSTSLTTFISLSPSPSLDLFSALALQEEVSLDRKIVRQVTELFSRSTFIYALDYDISNSFQRTYEDPDADDRRIPLWKKTDRRFWWNEYMCRDFKTNNLDEWIIPVIQGTIQIETCEIESKQFEFILISRRSRERAGMRYQRRGVNERGESANFVETEQIVIFNRDNVPHVTAFVQTRGSIPLFWSQSPYSLHPIPTLDRTAKENNLAFERHFAQQEHWYKRQFAVNLTELTGREAIVGSAFRRHVEQLADPNITYIEFDFHRETKGMRFENISKLIASLRSDLDKLAYFWQAGENTVYCKQNGVFRTNCMDCLDRTNVVQSAFGREVLNLQLMRFNISEFHDEGISYYNDFERTFNHVWANNGDMISRMYTGTSALKGDFTRTGKRNITGMMNDASNSLARMYLNTVKDFWQQATIDYILGYHKVEIFRHVPEYTRMSAEPGNERRSAKIRMDAIGISSEIVIPDDEASIAGWTLLSPNEPQKTQSKKFEEKVILLTAKALYVCSYNYKLEKVVQFKRIELDTVSSIQRGEYILSSTTPLSRDTDQNYGFLLFYNADQESIRLNSGSIDNRSLNDLFLRSDSSSSTSVKISPSEAPNPVQPEQAFLAFKAVRYNVLGELPEYDEKTCREQVQDITETIARACGRAKDDHFVTYLPIISLEEAEDTDGIFKKMGLKIKQAIWM